MSRPVLDHIAERRERPAGRVRLVVSPLAAAMVLAPKLGAFAHAYPDVVLDVTTTNEMRLDLVAGHFDAGIHLGEFIERDMIAVRVSADQRAAIVGAPAYFDAHPKPKSPRDLVQAPVPQLSAWRGRNVSLGVRQGQAVARGGRRRSIGRRRCAVADSRGHRRRRPDVSHGGAGRSVPLDGQLVRVLEDWCEPFAGYFLYYPSRRQQPAALTALIETLRLEGNRRK